MPEWLQSPRSIWALGIALAFLLGFLMGMYQETEGEPEDHVDMREDPLAYHNMQDEEYGFHKRRATTQK